jgi:hypothetical protein
MGEWAHVGLGLAASMVLLPLLAADPRWSGMEVRTLDPGESVLARTWLLLAQALPLLDVAHRGELSLHGSIVALATLCALAAASLHERPARAFVAVAAATLVTVGASHWLRAHLAVSDRADRILPSLLAAIALSAAMLALRSPVPAMTRSVRVVLLVAVGAAAGMDAGGPLDPWPSLLVVLALAATSWERIAASDLMAPAIPGHATAAPASRLSLASIVVSMLALGVAARRGPWVDAPVADARPSDGFVRRVILAGPPPRDVIVLHDAELRRELKVALAPELRPDVTFEPVDAGHPEATDASATDPFGPEPLAPDPFGPRGITSDSFWPRGGEQYGWRLTDVHEVGPLFRHRAPVPGASATAPRWVLLPPAAANLPARERGRFARAALERARFRRALGRPELAISAWPLDTAHDPELRERLRLGWLIRASMSPPRAPVEIAPMVLRARVEALGDPLVAHAFAEIDAAELAYALGRDGLARGLIDDAATIGRIEAIVALLRWQAHLGARAAFDANTATLVVDDLGRLHAFDTVHWLARRGFDERARTLATAASHREGDAAAHVAALLAATLADARAASTTR